MSKKLSKSRASANHFSVKSKPISKSMEEKLKIANENANKKIAANNIIYQQSNSHSSEHVILSSTNASRFYENIDKMKSPHKAEITSSERFGSIEDYSEYQEQKDLKNYKSFINSSAYDDVKKVETEMGHQKILTLDYLRKRGAQHDD